jgi:hypothetical protein
VILEPKLIAPRWDGRSSKKLEKEYTNSLSNEKFWGRNRHKAAGGKTDLPEFTETTAR